MLESDKGKKLSTVGQVLRSKGFFWLCTRPAEMMVGLIVVVVIVVVFVGEAAVIVVVLMVVVVLLLWLLRCYY